MQPFLASLISHPTSFVRGTYFPLARCRLPPAGYIGISAPSSVTLYAAQSSAGVFLCQGTLDSRNLRGHLFPPSPLLRPQTGIPFLYLLPKVTCSFLPTRQPGPGQSSSQWAQVLPETWNGPETPCCSQAPDPSVCFVPVKFPKRYHQPPRGGVMSCISWVSLGSHVLWVPGIYKMYVEAASFACSTTSDVTLAPVPVPPVATEGHC